MTKGRVTEQGETRVCGEGADGGLYGVTQLKSTGGKHIFRLEPCEQCPWRMDVPTGVFPSEAYRESAPTAYDVAMSTFACHMSGKENPATCAGFMLRHAENNMQVRLTERLRGQPIPKITNGGHPIYRSYREMAVANGVNPDDPVLKPIRGNNDR